MEFANRERRTLVAFVEHSGQPSRSARRALQTLSRQQRLEKTLRCSSTPSRRVAQRNRDRGQSRAARIEHRPKHETSAGVGETGLRSRAERSELRGHVCFLALRSRSDHRRTRSSAKTAARIFARTARRRLHGRFASRSKSSRRRQTIHPNCKTRPDLRRRKTSARRRTQQSRRYFTHSDKSDANAEANSGAREFALVFR